MNRAELRATEQAYYCWDALIHSDDKRSVVEQTDALMNDLDLDPATGEPPTRRVSLLDYLAPAARAAVCSIPTGFDGSHQELRVLLGLGW